MKQPNIIAFTQRPSTGSAADYEIGPKLTAWINYVGALNNSKNGEFWCDVTERPNDKRPGASYHKWIKDGYLIHQYGFDVANHFIKLPKTWLDETYTIEHIDAYRDDDLGVNIEAHDVITKNGEFYKHGLITNQTDCLVKLTDENYEELKSLIAVDFSNIYAEQYYFKAIAEGGEFYKQPETIV